MSHNFTKEEIRAKAKEYFSTQEITITNNITKATAKFSPISACTETLNVRANELVAGVLNGFLNFLFKEDIFDSLMKDIKLPSEDEQNPN